MTLERDLSRRERQIRDALFKHGEADVPAIQTSLPNPPGEMAIREMLSILESKGHVSRRKGGRKFIVHPAQHREKAGGQAMRHWIKTFFGGSVEQALATHLQDPNIKLTI